MSATSLLPIKLPTFRLAILSLVTFLPLLPSPPSLAIFIHWMGAHAHFSQGLGGDPRIAYRTWPTIGANPIRINNYCISPNVGRYYGLVTGPPPPAMEATMEATMETAAATERFRRLFVCLFVCL